MSFVLRDQIDRGGKVYGAWVASGSSRNAETVVRAGFDFVVFDVQHGEASYAEVRAGIAALRMMGRPAGVRAGLDGHGDAARYLDLGAELIVMPMVNSGADARKLVDVLRYPPLGGRSWGPARAMSLLDVDAETYRAEANRAAIVLAMIETTAAMAAIGEILDCEGIDGIFIGPSDLSISLSNGAKLDHSSEAVRHALQTALAAAKARGKLSGIFCASGAAAAHNAHLGFDILAIASDLAFLTEGAKSVLQSAREGAGMPGIGGQGY